MWVLESFSRYTFLGCYEFHSGFCDKSMFLAWSTLISSIRSRNYPILTASQIRRYWEGNSFTCHKYSVFLSSIPFAFPGLFDNSTWYVWCMTPFLMLQALHMLLGMLCARTNSCSALDADINVGLDRSHFRTYVGASNSYLQGSILSWFFLLVNGVIFPHAGPFMLSKCAYFCLSTLAFRPRCLHLYLLAVTKAASA